jgi:cytochrome c peroxidase
MGEKHNYFNLRGGELTEADNGRFNVTKDEKDRHFFKVPSLRNVELTFPYFHDGSTANLADAIKMMAKVQRNKDLTKDEITQIEDFLKSLTGEYKGKLVTKLNDKDVQ